MPKTVVHLGKTASVCPFLRGWEGIYCMEVVAWLYTDGNERKEEFCVFVCVFHKDLCHGYYDCNTFLDMGNLVLVAATACLCRSNRNSGWVDMQTTNVLIVRFSCLTSERCRRTSPGHPASHLWSCCHCYNIFRSKMAKPVNICGGSVWWCLPLGCVDFWEEGVLFNWELGTEKEAFPLSCLIPSSRFVFSVDTHAFRGLLGLH